MKFLNSLKRALGFTTKNKKHGRRHRRTRRRKFFA